MKPIIFCSCGGNDIKEQSEIDSLRNELAQKTAELEMANDFLTFTVQTRPPCNESDGKASSHSCHQQGFHCPLLL